MSESDIASWKKQNVDIESANFLNSNDVSPQEYSEWKANDFDDAETIIEWRTNKFSPAEASNWVKGDFTLKDAITNRSKGLQPVK